MNIGSVDGYAYLRKGIAVVGAAALLIGSGAGGALALDGGYGEAKKVGGDAEYVFEASTYTTVAGDTLYQYATGEDGYGYETSYDGSAWTEWTGYEAPAKFTYDPAPVAYKDAAYVTYRGDDGKYYFSAGGGEYQDISGDYTFKCAPYANVYNDLLYVYGVADDGYVYWNHYDGAEWSGWGLIGEESTAAYEVYAVEWDGWNNVFWTSEDGATYWNRWDGTEWSGVKALAGETKVEYAPYAVGYEDNLYAYASTGGTPAVNVFTAGEGWGGWNEIDGYAGGKAKGQPSAYVYEDAQHIVYTADDNHGYYTEYAGSWSGEWADAGENYRWDPAQYEYEGDLYLTYTGENGYAYVKAYAAGEGDDGY